MCMIVFCINTNNDVLTIFHNVGIKCLVRVGSAGTSFWGGQGGHLPLPDFEK